VADQIINTKNFWLICSLVFILFTADLAKAETSRDINVRRRIFYAAIDSLQKPDRNPDLRPWLHQAQLFNRKDLRLYSEELQNTFSTRQPELNRNQQIVWLFETGMLQTALDSTSSAMKYYNAAKKLNDKTKDPNTYLRIRFEQAFLYRQMKNCRKSNELFSELLTLAGQMNNRDEQNRIRYWMAENYNNLGQYDEALTLTRELYQYSMEKKDFANASYDMVQLGQISSLIESDTSYLEYYHSAVELAFKSGYMNIYGNNLSQIAQAYCKAGFPRASLVYFEKAFNKIDFLSDREKVELMNGISNTYLALDSLEKAKYYAQLSLNESRSLSGELWQSGAVLALADCFMKSNQLDSALFFLRHAAALHQNQGNDYELIQIYKDLSEVYTKLNQHETALQYLDSSFQINNRVVADNNTTLLTRLRTETDYYIQKNRITELVSDNKLAIAQSKRTRDILIVVGLLLIVSIVFFWFSRIQVKRLKESHLNLLKKNVELDRANKEIKDRKTEERIKNKSNGTAMNGELQEELLRLLNDENIYADSNLSLKSLADAMNTNTAYLSSLINTQFNCNFKTLINQMRIDKAKEVLISTQYRNYSMEGIAEMVGFKSRSAFYSSFKGFTGLTPSQYIESYELLVSQKESTDPELPDNQ